jgi:hypothetical protein
MYFLGLIFHHIDMCEIQLFCDHGGFERVNAREDQNMCVWTIFQTIENGWDSNFFVKCSLFDFYAKCGYKKPW